MNQGKISSKTTTSLMLCNSRRWQQTSSSNMAGSTKVSRSLSASSRCTSCKFAGTSSGSRMQSSRRPWRFCIGGVALSLQRYSDIVICTHTARCGCVFYPHPSFPVWAQQTLMEVGSLPSCRNSSRGRQHHLIRGQTKACKRRSSSSMRSCTGRLPFSDRWRSSHSRGCPQSPMRTEYLQDHQRRLLRLPALPRLRGCLKNLLKHRL
mmetsp:Transcript_66170/g.126137  ORF Transcript_66170/g.126137 Transcript_66170/m.126137 type:complete len:207 (-) Transcript_66170:520-1140(-)